MTNGLKTEPQPTIQNSKFKIQNLRAKAQIYPCPNKRMAGPELRRLRILAALSEREVAERLGTYREKIQRWEKKMWFELHPIIMQQLLDILGATSL